MDTKSMKEKMVQAFEVIEGIERIDKAVEEIGVNGICVETKFRKDVTMFLDEEIKEQISAIVIPHLTEKREELLKYINEKMNGGIIK